MGFSTNSGAIFSKNGKERFVLWRFWDSSKPYVLFIGLNPSNADDTYNDPTTKRIIAHSKRLGYGGCFLMNCFTRIATNPDHLTPSGNWKQNCKWLDEVVPRSLFYKTIPVCKMSRTELKWFAKASSLSSLSGCFNPF